MQIAGPAKQVGRGLLAWDSDKVDVVLAARAAVAVAVALTITQLAGSPGWAPALMIGAWCCGIPLIVPDVRAQPWLPLLAGLGLAVAMLVGGLAGPFPVLSVAVAGLWALTMAWIGGLGGAAGVLTTVSGVVLVLAPPFTVDTPAPVAAAAVLAGGALQAAASLLPPWTRHRPERQLVADALRALAVDSYALADAMNTPLSTKALLEVHESVGGRRRLPKPMRELVGQLYELRAAVVAAAAARARLLRTDLPAARHTAAVLRNSAVALDKLAQSAERNQSPSTDWEARLASAVEAAPDEGTPRHTVAGQEVRRLYRALHHAARLVERLSEGENPTTVVSRRVRMRSRLAEDWQQLRANLTPRSPSAHHAVRAAVGIMAATAVGFAWPGVHGYWIPLTAWLVLRPDFAATVERGLGRMLGTALGVVLASVLALVILPGTLGAAVVVAGFALAGYLTLPASYVLYSAAVGAYTVYQIDLSNLSPVDAAWERGLAALIGGGLAIALYALWPTWQTPRLSELLAELVDAYRVYADLILACQADPDRRDPQAVRRAVDEIRLRREILSAAADQAAAEPIEGRPYGADALDAEAALSRAARALIVLEGGPRGRSAEDTAELPGADVFRAVIDDGYARLAQRLRDGRRRVPPDFDAAMDQLDSTIAEGDAASQRRRRLLDWESDILVDSMRDAYLVVDSWAEDD